MLEIGRDKKRWGKSHTMKNRIWYLASLCPHPQPNVNLFLRWSHRHVLLSTIWWEVDIFLPRKLLLASGWRMLRTERARKGTFPPNGWLCFSEVSRLVVYAGTRAQPCWKQIHRRQTRRSLHGFAVFAVAWSETATTFVFFCQAISRAHVPWSCFSLSNIGPSQNH